MDDPIMPGYRKDLNWGNVPNSTFYCLWTGAILLYVSGLALDNVYPIFLGLVVSIFSLYAAIKKENADEEGAA